MDRTSILSIRDLVLDGSERIGWVSCYCESCQTRSSCSSEILVNNAERRLDMHLSSLWFCGSVCLHCGLLQVRLLSEYDHQILWTEIVQPTTIKKDAFSKCRVLSQERSSARNQNRLSFPS